ncbi:tumor suppressor p130, putative [Ixodes scapularis]|uniref:Tumor suppressor p130, putative n=1 Tax=Ixodes scapularis TaxID=6945 RepID=B7PSX1_IXOSC|nr:tumor suppressor p130, putative [Ixodes scapularis]|eukprot:XP_002403233.1 tumor suppressor p130, putative [Ixodes scapularis]
MKKWADMANLNERMRRRIETIEKSFCVTAKIYEKYVGIFAAVFKEPQVEAPRRLTKGAKRRVHRQVWKNLNKTYEEHVLKEGELDERIFLASDAHERIGTPRHFADSVQRELHRPRMPGIVNFQKLEVQPLLTPLTGRGNLHNREAINRSPVSTATQCASKLQALLAGCKNAASKELQALFGEFDSTLETSIQETVKEMGDIFCEAFAQPVSDQRGGSAHMDFARKRLQLGETLFFKALENIIAIEKKQQKPNTDLSAHLCHTVFQQSLFACCLEIVMFCYNSQRLGIQQKDIRLKIWTCFEHSIVNHIELMKDRHLDQLILCAVYVITKVTRVEKSFQEILQCYRQQPQNKSHVYRSVLLRKSAGHSDHSSRTGSNSSSPVTVENEDGGEHHQFCSTRSSSTLPLLPPNSQPPTPTRLAGTATQFEFDERGDIIKFYNEIYRKRMTTFATKFSPDSNKNEAMCLTPLPRSKCMLNSPRRRVSYNRDVFVSPLKAGSYPVSPKHHTYHFNQSPAKDLRAINQMVQGSDNVSKRLLHEDDASDDDAPPTKRCFFKKIQTVIKERQDVCGTSSVDT